MARDVFRNPLRADVTTVALTEPLPFHRRIPGYAPTALVDAPRIAADLGLGRVLVKDEESRFGLPAFKVLGASWASFRAVLDRLGRDPGPWDSLEDLAARLAPMRPFTLAAATDGNHGRAVARMARALGFDATIYVPDDMVPARIDAIEGEGATVVVVDGTYDDAVTRAAKEEGERSLVISDTSWPGYDLVPGWVIEGYGTIFWELEDTLAAAQLPYPDLVVCPIGVGALAAATVVHFRRAGRERPPVLVGVEPIDAACVMASARAGEIVTVPGPHRSIMVGLNCGTPSVLAWPRVSAGFDWFMAVDDDRARAAMRALADVGVVSGETGAAAVAGLNALLDGADGPDLRGELGLDSSSTVLVLSTEGATDPGNYRRIVGRAPEDVARAQRLG